MFNRKTCGRCGRNLRNSFSFCPYCGNPLEKKQEDSGMLGKSDTDFSNQMNPFANAGMGGFNTIFNSLLRNLEKQFREEDKKNALPNFPKGNISISISTGGNGMPFMNMNPGGKENKKKKHDEVKKFFFNNFNSEKLKKYSSLPKSEPKTNIRRISNKVFYEVDLPGVKSAKDVSIVHLEKNMELKAVSEKKAYAKIIPINLPIADYKLSKGKLTLEMDAQAD